MSQLGHSLPVARRRAGREVRSSPIADVIPTPWLMLLALSNRGVCPCVAIRVEDVAASGYTADRATVRQKKTGRPVRFELGEQTREAIGDYLKAANKRPGEFLFTGRRGPETNMTTRQYARLVSEWIGSVGLDPRLFGTH
jgi:integrase